MEREADFYEETWERLDAMGLKQYEVSNFARPGMQCLHNLNTWRMHEWIGFGPSAASQHGGRRFSNEANLEKWMFGIEEARPARMEDSELSMGELALDSIVFGLRMNAGVDLAGLEGRFPGFDMASVEPFLQELVGQGLAVSEGRRYALTLSGLMVVDRIGSELLCR